MSEDLIDALEVLLAASLAQWRCTEVAEISRRPDDALALRTEQHAVMIERAPAELPFRWVVGVDGRKRAAASVVGVLRIVRQTVSSGYTPGHVTIAELPRAPE